MLQGIVTQNLARLFRGGDGFSLRPVQAFYRHPHFERYFWAPHHVQIRSIEAATVAEEVRWSRGWIRHLHEKVKQYGNEAQVEKLMFLSPASE